MFREIHEVKTCISVLMTTYTQTLIVLHKSMFLTPVVWCVAVEGVITVYALCF